MLGQAEQEKADLEGQMNDTTDHQSDLKEALIDLQKLNEELGNEKIQLNQVWKYTEQWTINCSANVKCKLVLNQRKRKNDAKIQYWLYHWLCIIDTDQSW